MFRVLNSLSVDHDWRLVVVAAMVCFLASLTAVNLFHRARATRGLLRAAWILIAGAATGFGVWATHSISMLAYNPGFPIGYHIGFLSLSLLTAMVVTSGGLTLALASSARWAVPVAGAIVGAGFASKHYIAMWAVELPGRLTWSPDLVVVSIAVAVLLSMVGLAMIVRRDDLRGTGAAALCLTLAIVSIHFIAMGAVEIVPDPTRIISATSLSPNALAVVAAAVAVSIPGMALVGAFSDRRSNDKLRNANLRLDAALNNMRHGLCMYDSEERLVLCNERYIQMFRLSRGAVKRGSTTLREIFALRKASGTFWGDPEEYAANLRSKIAEGRTFSMIGETRDGRVIVVVNQPLEAGGWVSTFEDVTERKQFEAQIAHMAHHDALTNLPNRAAFTKRLAEMLERAASQGEQLAMLCVDFDRFTEINDMFGHSLGDALLRELSRRLRAAAEGAFLARVGGDQFALIVTGVQPRTVERLAQCLITAVAEEIEIEGHRLRISFTAGVAFFPADGLDAATLSRNADAALSRAKAQARGSIRFFQAEMDERVRDRRALQHDLRSAVARGELVLHYQPQAVIGGDVVSFEALVRWNHGARGLLPPGEFIPLAEESGQMVSLGEWILREACREAASWPKPLQIAINLSPIQFQHGDVVGLVHQVLLETGLTAGRLVLEITEGALIGEFSRAVSILRRLKALGVGIAMDDFGTGYSSLSYLQAFPFNKIKIDRAFIANVDCNPQSATIVRAVIGLGRSLDLSVVAEGVETEAQLAFLRQEGCDEVQGYLIGCPLPIENYAEMIGRPLSIRPKSLRAG